MLNREATPTTRQTQQKWGGNHAATALSVALSLGLTLVGCGGGGGGFNDTIPDPDGGTSLTARLLWQQRSAGRGAENFQAILPKAVRSVRIALTLEGGLECCVSVDPRDEAFDQPGQGGLVLKDLSAGDAVLEIAGFASSTAPAQGVPLLCSVAPPEVGDECDAGNQPTPTFLADPLEVTLVSGSRKLTELELKALPFLADSDPEAGQTVRTPGSFSLVVADAATGINEASIALRVARDDAPSSPLAADSVDVCDDADLGEDPCSDGRSLSVFGFRVEGSLDGADEAPATIEVSARNRNSPANQFESSYEIETVPQQVDVTFRLNSTVTVGALRFDVNYSAANGEFVGNRGLVDCTALSIGDLVSFDDVDNSQTLIVRAVSNPGIDGPKDLARCRFEDFETVPDTGDFVITVVEAADENATPIQPLPSLSATSIEAVQ